MTAPTIASTGRGLVCPPGTLAALQEIDAKADLIHLGGSHWLLGVRQPNAAARERIERQLRQLHGARIGAIDRADRALLESDMARELHVLQLCADGFRPIHLYDVQSPADLAALVEDFRLRDFNWRTRPDAAFQELRDELSFDVQDQKRTALVREYFDQEGGSLFHKVMRRAKSFLFS